MAVAGLRCDGDSFGSTSYNWYYQIRSVKIQLCSVLTPTKSAQAIISIFSPKIHLGPNWQQSTTTYCESDSDTSDSNPSDSQSILSELHLSRATAIFVVDCCQFGPSWIFGLKMELMACADLVGVTTDQSCLFPDLIC